MSDAGAAVWQSVTVSGSVGGSAGPGNIFVAKTPEAPVIPYDSDGNLLEDGRWLYTWDAENRLTKMESRTDAPAGSKRRLEFEYDFMGRRIKKIATNLDTSVVDEIRFIYDGWNLIAELNANLTPRRSYVWGLDLSGSVTGAGGVGGLLIVRDHALGTYQLPGYDGNGNVCGLVEAVNGTASGVYEYGPFGEVIRATGSLAKANPFRFSTKYQDNESDLLYYGHRYYNPLTGRWPNRDPLEEAGGINLFGCVHNNPVNYVDSDGRQIFPPYQPPPPRPPPGKPNEESFYNVHYSKNSITLNFHGCCNCDELRDRLYGDLKTFKDWGKNSVASINVSGDIASFYPGLGVASGGGLAGNDANWRVRLSNDDSTRCVSARTLDDHPLVGVRKWCASLSKNGTSCAITITTEAYERPRNWQNYIGGQWFGRNDQRQIWEDYLGNIAGAYKDDSCYQSSQCGTPIQRDTGSTTNPWVP